MAETQTKKKKNVIRSKFSLVELLTIIILIGLLFIIIVPVKQAKLSSERVTAAVQTIQMISAEAVQFKNNPENGYYPDIDQLNLGDKIKSEYFTYSISAEDTSGVVLAVTKPAFGKEDLYLTYNIANKQFQVGKSESDQVSSKYINENWLP